MGRLRYRSRRLLGHHLERVRRVRTWTAEVPLDHCDKVGEDGVVDGKLPLEITAHLSLHLVDLAEGEHALGDDAPRLVRIGVVADNL